MLASQLLKVNISLLRFINLLFLLSFLLSIVYKFYATLNLTNSITFNGWHILRWITGVKHNNLRLNASFKKYGKIVEDNRYIREHYYDKSDY